MQLERFKCIKKNISSEMFQWPEPANCIFDKSNPVYYHYKKNKIPIKN